ncbi:poly-gamma-glutamate system protein [Leptospira sp. 201903070]|uniref:Poly-gamma-glutamate system protein n=1 Tax=Leptospira ainlahdjerensis TaxID=2810033 RepID=A0ABS2UDH5_9LEPT|nr:poly-gamma-glutamate system protein [Leptospira ainlahdjerensis]MBM9578414.1 poly-gamma-glutamate system protein [Leptospira ainlahdjerensis]
MKVWFLRNRSSLLIIALSLFSLFAWGLVEFFPEVKPVSEFKLKQDASQRAFLCIQRIARLRQEKGLKIDSDLDPSRSGLIGLELSPVTSSSGKLASKQASIHPDFAIWFVNQFLKVGLKKGDEIAVGISGSFPALNIALFAAADAIGIRVNTIGSVSSSQYGANLTDLLWPDMENLLFQEGYIFQKTNVFSTGGIDDQGIGIGKVGLIRIRDSIRRNGYPYLSVESFEDSLLKRIRIYEKSNVSLYVNVGGGTVSTGTSLGKKKIPKGLVYGMEEFSELPDSILKYYLEKKIPVLHVIGIESISEESGMRYTKDVVSKPGTSNLLYTKTMDRRIAGGFFFLICFLIWKLSPWISLGETKKENTIHL